MALVFIAAAALLLIDPAIRPAAAGFFDFLFPDSPTDTDRPAQKNNASSQPSLFPNPFESEKPASQPALPPYGGGTPVANRSSTAHCVRMCDGKHFSISTRGDVSQNAMCQAFCPASNTKVFFGNQIERAISIDGERYSELPTAFAYRKKLSADCTCNGRDPAGLAPVDISVDSTLRPGDVVATATGFVAYNGGRGANGVDGSFTPVASYPGLTPATRARLGETRVAPVTAEVPVEHTGSIDTIRETGAVKPRAALE
ncbi:MAG: DUF2865 domain-containing protein [Xanthobacteraceae bacterium]